MRDLLVSAFTPTLSSGQGLRTYGIVKALAGLGPVDLLYAVFGADEPAAEYETVAGLRMIPVHPTRGGRRIVSYARALADGVPDVFARGSSAELTELAEDLASAQGRGRVIADGPVAGASLREFATRRAVTYNAHNLESSFRHLIGPTSRRARRRLERFEARLIWSCDEVWMASRADVVAARELVPGARLRYVPNVVDTTRIRPTSDSTDQVVLFVGDFTYAPNVQGLDYLEAAVLPALWDRLPTARVEVAGRGLDERAGSDPRLSISRIRPRPGQGLCEGRLRRDSAAVGRRVAAEVRRGTRLRFGDRRNTGCRPGHRSQSRQGLPRGFGSAGLHRRGRLGAARRAIRSPAQCSRARRGPVLDRIAAGALG